MVIQLRASEESAFRRGFLSTAAKITRQELSPKVLLIAGKSHLVPHWESILRLKASTLFLEMCLLTDICKPGQTLNYNGLTYLCFITLAVIFYSGKINGQTG